MKKKFISLILCFIVLGFCGCARNEIPKNNKLKIVTSVFPVYDFAKNICGELADVSLLVPVGNDIHHFEPTPNDIIELSNSDLFIYIGGENESWISDIIKTANVKNELSLISNFNLISLEINEHHKHEKYDEHIWTSVKNSSKICDLIFNKISQIDSDNKSAYEKNLTTYKEKLNNLDNMFSEIVTNKKRNTVVFGDRFPFLYFVKDYGLNYHSAFPSCAEESEPSAATIANLLNILNEENIPSVFYIEFSNEKVADILCENSDRKKLLFHSCHSITKEDFQNGVGYIELMTKNAENLKEALY